MLVVKVRGMVKKGWKEFRFQVVVVLVIV